MNKKNLILGVTAATLVNVASATNPALLIEKQVKPETISKLLDGITVIKAAPECSLKQITE